MLANVTILMFEELNGAWASPEPGQVLAANFSWFVFPLLVAARLWRDHPFTEEPRA